MSLVGSVPSRLMVFESASLTFSPSWKNDQRHGHHAKLGEFTRASDVMGPVTLMESAVLCPSSTCCRALKARSDGVRGGAKGGGGGLRCSSG